MSNSSSGPDGDIGFKDASDDLTVKPAATASFSLSDAGEMTAGGRAEYTVTRYDVYDNEATDGDLTVYLYSSSSGTNKWFYDAATGGSVITQIIIPNGASSAQFWYYDEEAGEWTITVSDSSPEPDGDTGIKDASDDLTVKPAATASFSLSGMGEITAGERAGYTVTRYDAHGNLVTAGAQTVYLYSNSSGTNARFYDAATGGSVITQITIPDGASSAQFWYYDDKAGDWTITVSDSSTAPDGDTGIKDASDDLTVKPAATASFGLSNAGEMTAGERAGYTVTRYDEYGNLVTAGAQTVYLYSSSDGTNAKFYDAATGGSVISQITIPNGASSAQFWYYDEKAGDWTITVSDSSPTPDGDTGIKDASDDLTVLPSAPAQLAFVSQPTSAVAGTVIAPAVAVQLRDAFGNDVPQAGVGLTLTLSSGSGVLTGVTMSSTDASGLATFSELSVDLAGVKKLTATAPGLSGAVSESFSIVPGPIATGRVTAAPAEGVTADGVDTSTVSIAVTDEYGNPIPGLNNEDFVVDAGSNAIAGVVSESKTAGTYTCAVTNTVAETVTVRVTAGGVLLDDQPQITFVPGAASADTSTIYTDKPEVVMDGQSAAIVTVELVDALGNPLTRGGDTVELATTLGSLSDVVDNNDGTYTAELSSTVAGIATITAKVNGAEMEDSATVSFVAGVVHLEVLMTGEGPSGSSVLPGETIRYAVVVKNTGTGLAKDVRATALLHAITTYVPGSLEINGIRQTDTLGGGAFFDSEKGQVVVGTADHPIDLKPGERLEVSYLAKLSRAAAGSAVETLARATCRNIAGAVTETRSGPVRLELAAMVDLSLDGGVTRSAVPGTTANFPVVLTNEGNIVDSYRLGAESDPGDADILVTWHYDLDRDGRLSPDEPEIQADSTGAYVAGPLGAEEAAHLVARVRVADSVQPGPITIVFSATSSTKADMWRSVQNRLLVSNLAPCVEVHGVPDIIYAGESYTYQISYGYSQSNGFVPPYARVTVSLPGELSFVSASDGGVYDDATRKVTWETDSVSGTCSITVMTHRTGAIQADVWNAAEFAVGESVPVTSRQVTRVVASSPAGIDLSAEPGVVLGDGLSEARIRAVIVDLLGNPVPDSVEVAFTTTDGHFAGGTQIVSIRPVSGVAETRLTAPLITGADSRTARVYVEAKDDIGSVLSHIEVLFAPGAIVGRIIDSRTGLPESGVEVRLMDGDEVVAWTVTDEEGYYVLRAPYEGVFTVVVVRNTSEEGVNIEQTIDVSDADSALTSGPRIVSGRLVEKGTNKGISGARVIIRDEYGQVLAEAMTDDNGYYVVHLWMGEESARSASTFTMRSLANSSDTRLSSNLATWTVEGVTGDGKVAKAALPALQLGDIVTNVVVEMEPTGQVVDAVTGLPIAGAHVTLLHAGPNTLGEIVVLPPKDGLPQSNPAIASVGGFYSFAVTPGYYQLRVEAAGYEVFESEPFVVQGTSVAQDISMSPLDESGLALALEVSSRYSRVGERIQFAVTVTNTTNSVLNGVTVIDYLPSGLEYVDSATRSSDPLNNGPFSPQAVYDDSNRTITWTIPQLQPGQAGAMVLAFEAEVQSVLAGTHVVNLAIARVGNRSAYVSATAATTVGEWPSLDVTKHASQAVVSIGSAVRYRVTVTNRDDVAAPVPLFDACIVDTLPEGFVYVEGSTRINDAEAADPRVEGGSLVWTLGTMNPGDSVTLHYVASASIDATGSDGINTVFVRGQNPSGMTFETDSVSAQVQVSAGVFGSLGTVVGTVYIDRDGNGQKDPTDPGVAGAIVYTDDGRKVVTDAHGRYSVRGMYPGLRSLKAVLPEGVESAHGLAETAAASASTEATGPVTGTDLAETVACIQASAGAGVSRFVQVPVGGVVVANFGLAPVSQDDSGGSGGEEVAGGSSAVSVGVLDIVAPSDKAAEVRYGSIFWSGEIADGQTLTVAYRTVGPEYGQSGQDGGTHSDSTRLLPMGDTGLTPQPLADRSSEEDLARGSQGAYVRLETEDSIITYGSFEPEPSRSNRFASRTAPLTGVLAQFGGASASRPVSLTVYGASVTGQARFERFEDLGTSGPFFLAQAPVVQDSDEVWLVTLADRSVTEGSTAAQAGSAAGTHTDGEHEVERTKLVRGVDYRIDYSNGVMWLASAVPGYDEVLNRRVIEVAYRSVRAGVVGEVVGMRVDGQAGASRFGLSASHEVVGAQTHELLGIDGSVRLHEKVDVVYEVGIAEIETPNTYHSGIGLRLQSGAVLTDRMNLQFKAEYVTGQLWPAGGRTIAEGTRASGTLTYELLDAMQLCYDRGYIQAPNRAGEHIDALRLSGSVNDRPASGLTYEFGVTSRGESILPAPDRRTELHADAGWSCGDEHRLSLSAGVRAESASNWQVTVPVKVSYQTSLGNVKTVISYGQALGQADSGVWTASLESTAPNMPSAYTRYQVGDEISELSIGARHGWKLSDDLRLSVRAEGRLGNGSQQRAAASWELCYEPAEDKKLVVGQEYELKGANLATTTRGLWSGTLFTGLTYRLSGFWSDGNLPVSDGRRTLIRNVELAFDYRDTAQSRHAVLGQYVSRTYTQRGQNGFEDSQSDVDMLAIDWAYSLTDRVSLSSKAGWKREQAGWSLAGGGEERYTTDIWVAQLGVELPLSGRFTLESFARALWDSNGAMRSGVAVELVYALTESIGISVGTSTLGVDDPDLRTVAPWPEGLYYRLRLKL